MTNHPPPPTPAGPGRVGERLAAPSHLGVDHQEGEHAVLFQVGVSALSVSGLHLVGAVQVLQRHRGDVDPPGGDEDTEAETAGNRDVCFGLFFSPSTGQCFSRRTISDPLREYGGLIFSEVSTKLPDNFS